MSCELYWDVRRSVTDRQMVGGSHAQVMCFDYNLSLFSRYTLLVLNIRHIFSHIIMRAK